MISLYLNNIASMRKELGQYDQAIAYYRESINIKEKLRKTATGDIRRDYLANQINTYQSLASAYLDNEDPDNVLLSIELSRAKLLAERIAGVDSGLSFPSVDQVRGGLTTDEAVLIFSNIDWNKFIVMVITDSGVWYGEIRKADYLIQAKSLYQQPVLKLLDKQRGIALKQKKEETRQIGKNAVNNSAFEKSINHYRTTLIQSATENQPGIGMAEKNNTALSHSRAFSRALYDLLIKPAADKLTGKKKLLIMPDGILGVLPFETLINENNQYLAEKFDIKYTQSMTISRLLDSRQYKNDRKPMLALGGAVYDEITYKTDMLGDAVQLASLEKDVSDAFEQNRSLRASYEKLDMARWTNLPGTLKEVKTISRIVAKTEVITGDDVTENKVKRLSKSGELANYKVLHFATHGLVVPALPELSAIVLSQFKEEKDGEDGYLRMGEIAGLSIRADFINLSACETGLGKIYGGEGVVGLTQSFLIAGANGLSVSLWQVADDSTSKFMTELYRKVEQKGIGYSQAIAETKRSFISGEYGDKWKAPYYWSPFVYYGK
ncbi:CHAT domain-containing protein [bacterium]|nr:CHAT domain-containing protein [bacterium]